MELKYHSVREPVETWSARLALRHRDRRRESDQPADQYEWYHQPVPWQYGPAMAIEMIERGDLLRLSKTVIRPFYK